MERPTEHSRFPSTLKSIGLLHKKSASVYTVKVPRFQCNAFSKASAIVLNEAYPLVSALDCSLQKLGKIH